jgi:hypothetical protein
LRVRLDKLSKAQLQDLIVEVSCQWGFSQASTFIADWIKENGSAKKAAAKKSVEPSASAPDPIGESSKTIITSETKRPPRTAVKTAGVIDLQDTISSPAKYENKKPRTKQTARKSTGADAPPALKRKLDAETLGEGSSKPKVNAHVYTW